MDKHASIAIVINNNTVLLQKREDFRIWTLPGGEVENGEIYEEAAIRETKEETGLIVKIVRHVANIHRPQLGDFQHIYLCRVIGGEIIKQSSETVDVSWFPIDKLPTNYGKNTAQYISMALSNESTVIDETIRYSSWFLIARRIALNLRRFRNQIRG